MCNRALSLMLLLLIFFIPATVLCQLQKGMSTFEQYGAVSYSKLNDISLFSIRGNTERARMLSDRFMLGTGVGASYSANQGVNVYALTASPLARFYFNPTHPKTNFYLGMEAEVRTNFGDFDGSTFTDLYPHAGVNHFLYPDLSIMAQAGIVYPTYIPDVSIVSIFISFEPFFNAESWQARKSQTSSLTADTWFLQNPSARFSFVNESSTIDISTALGHMLTSKLALGAFLNFFSFAGSSTNFTAEAFARFYLTQNRTSWYLEAQGGPTFFSSTQTESFTVFNYFLGGGFTQFLSPRVALDIQAGLTITDGFFPTNTKRFGGTMGMQYMLSAE